jgi:hypothetical protein
MVYPFCSIEDLTPQELKELEEESKKWHKRFQSRKRAIAASRNIRQKDLDVIISPQSRVDLEGK